MQQRFKQRQANSCQSPVHSKFSDGFALPLVVLLGLIMTVGGMAMLTRMFGGLVGSIKYEQTQQARAIAEAGLSKTIAKLNNDYNYLLINCYASNGVLPTPNNCPSAGQWDSNPSFPSSVCPNTTLTGTPSLTANHEDPPGQYTIDYYIFDRGDQHYGGEGRLRVTGHRMNSDLSKTLSSASIEIGFDVKIKPCGATYDTAPTSSGFPGLMAHSISMGQNDVIGETSGNILCTNCTIPDYIDEDDDGDIDYDDMQVTNEGQISCGTNCNVGGSIFLGPISIPDVETFPTNLTATSHDIDLKDGDVVITAGNTDATQGSGGGATTLASICAIDTNTPPTTHCQIGDISGSGKKTLTVENTTSNPVILYISGDITLSGKSGIVHTGRAVDLTLAGVPDSTNDKCTDTSLADYSTHYEQTITLSGGATGSNLFAHFPCGLVGINGGSSDNCDADDDTCGGGDIRGAVWAKEWNGSAGNGAQLVVPPDFPFDLSQSKGDAYAVSINEYIALGVNDWTSIYD